MSGALSAIIIVAAVMFAESIGEFGNRSRHLLPQILWSLSPEVAAQA